MLECILLVCLVIMVGTYLLTLIGYPFYVMWNKFTWFYHDIMKWHRPDNKPQTFDGLSVHSKCKHCGEDIMQDSQGNWF